MKRLAVGLIFLIEGLCALETAAAASGCGGYRVTAGQTGGQTFDPHGAIGALIILSVEAEESGLDESCSSVPVVITPSRGMAFSLTNGAEEIALRPVRSGGVAQSTASRVELNGALRRDLVSGRSISFRAFEISSGAALPAGTYLGEVLIQAGSGPERVVPLAIEIPPLISFVAENGGTLRQLDFGDVTQGATITTSVFYRTNAAMVITIQSQNGGRLVHESGPAFGYINYQMRYGAVPVSLTSIVQLPLPEGGAGMRRDDIELRVAPPGPQFGGRYRDVLSLTYTAF